jgi:outer membrane protein OmpA-like peptidoglycan-associated protein
MFSSHKTRIGVRRISLAVGLASTLLAVAPGAFAQSATDIIRQLAPVQGDGGQVPPPHEGDGAPAHPYDGPGPAPAQPYDGPAQRGGGYGGYSGSHVEDTEVYIDGRHSRAYIDYSRAIDLTVYFEYNSARVTDRARETLDRLGEALASPELRRYRFLIAGHTDAVGTDEFNLDLSYRRAEAVRDYLAHTHGISRRRLAVKGWGRSRLKDTANPESGVNRRVEVALIVDHGTSWLEGDQPGYTDAAPGSHTTNRFRGRRPWFTCPPGSRLVDPLRPDLDIDDFAAGSPNPMCRPVD